uniref:Uncharacterized protein n=1 Tax=Hyaloperonospora arabidopsidis (strain Emoy2) TaxID=559515 RepID=M4B4G3_HYAAE
MDFALLPMPCRRCQSQSCVEIELDLSHTVVLPHGYMNVKVASQRRLLRRLETLVYTHDLLYTL